MCTVAPVLAPVWFVCWFGQGSVRKGLLEYLVDLLLLEIQFKFSSVYLKYLGTKSIFYNPLINYGYKGKSATTTKSNIFSFNISNFVCV